MVRTVIRVIIISLRLHNTDYKYYIKIFHLSFRYPKLTAIWEECEHSVHSRRLSSSKKEIEMSVFFVNEVNFKCQSHCGKDPLFCSLQVLIVIT